jgi:hypothetical protein
MTELLVALGLIAGVVVAHEVGFRLGSLVRSADERFDRQVALVQASTAALVAFLLAFAFSGAASRFIDRLDIIVKEANALGTAYLRADVIAEPQRSELKAALKEYTADRVQLLSGERRDQLPTLLAKVGCLHERMWQSAVKGTRENAPLMGVVLPPINDVIDLHTTHLTMAKRHLPLPIMVVLLATVAIGVGLVGFGNGRAGRRFTLLDSVYGGVLAIALWMTIDLDYPGMGLIRVNNHAVVGALASMK